MKIALWMIKDDKTVCKRMSVLLPFLETWGDGV